MGSISDNQRGESYGYRMSKAALNMMSKSMAIDLAGGGIISFVINPGWVQTDLGGASAPTPVGDSVRGILARIDEATLARLRPVPELEGRHVRVVITPRR